MPIFEYKCPKCKLLFELIQDHASNLEPCPNCKIPSVRILSAPVIRMEGLRQDASPNSPDNIQRSKELRNKHMRRGTAKEWQQENKERAKKDGGFSYDY